MTHPKMKRKNQSHLKAKKAKYYLIQFSILHLSKYQMTLVGQLLMALQRKTSRYLATQLLLRNIISLGLTLRNPLAVPQMKHWETLSNYLLMN
jgi:hypothetical protein